MSERTLDRLIWSSGFKPDRKIVLLALAYHANADGVSFPGVPLLARETGLTTRGVEKILASFVTTGILSIVERGNGRGHTNKYRIVGGALRSINPEPRSGFIEQKTEPETPNEVQGVTENPEPRSGFTEENPESGSVIQEENPEERSGFNSTNPEPGSVITTNPEPETPNGVRGNELNPESGSGFKSGKRRRNPEREAGACKEQPLKELKNINSLSADAPAESISKERCLAIFEENLKTCGGYDAPYMRKQGDFIQVEGLLKRCREANWPLTEARFLHALRNYMATPQGGHTLADFAVRFSEFYRSANDRFNKPVTENGGESGRKSTQPNAINRSANTQARGEDFEQVAERIKASKVL